MLLRTHTELAPWNVERANDKRLARLNLIRDIVSRLPCVGKKSKLVQPDPRMRSPRRSACRMPPRRGDCS